MKAPLHLFQCPIDRLESVELQTLVSCALVGQKLVTIATVNPEMLLAANRHQNVRRALCAMTHRIPDGIGISLVSRLLGYGAVPRHPGSDLFIDVCRSARPLKKRVVILGGWGTTTHRAVQVLKAAFPGLDVQGLGDITIRVENNSWDQPNNLLETLSRLQPDVLAVALGGSDHRQERWIADHAPRITGLKLALGVGGTIDMVAGTRKRAPGFMRRAGVEWLWRLILDPQRIGRIVQAVVVFPTMALLDRMKRHES